MKFCFVNPNRHIRRGNIWGVINSVTPPLGLATLSAVLDGAGHDSQVVDAYALELGPEATVAAIGKDATHVGITASTPEIGAACRLAALVREARPDVTVVMGGVHPTVEHRELVEGRHADIVVRGEGEGTVLDLAEGKPLASIPGITWRDGERVVVNPDRHDYVDLETLPFPSYRRLPMGRYRSALGAAKKSPSIGVITSRGCPGTCTFCFSGMFGQKIRFMSAGRVADLVAMLQRDYGIREVSFYDDTFTASRKRVHDFCETLLSRGMKVSWSCFARVDTVSPELLALMKRAGCHQVGYGFESPDEAILRNINKRIDADKIGRAVRWTREAGIDVRGAFMFGNVGETRETLQRTLDYSKSLGIQFAVYNITTPFPGTALFRQAREEGMLLHTDWEKYDLSHVILKLPTVDGEAVREYYARGYKEFYLRPRYVLERLAAIRTVDDVSVYWRAFSGLFRTKGTR